MSNNSSGVPDAVADAFDLNRHWAVRSHGRHEAEIGKAENQDDVVKAVSTAAPIAAALAAFAISTAIGTAIPIPLLGTAIGAVVGAFTAMGIAISSALEDTFHPDANVAASWLLLFQICPGLIYANVDTVTTHSGNRDMPAERLAVRLVRYLRLVSGIIRNPGGVLYNPNNDGYRANNLPTDTLQKNPYIESLVPNPGEALTDIKVTTWIKKLVEANKGLTTSPNIPSMLKSPVEAKAALGLLRAKKFADSGILSWEGIKDPATMAGLRAAVGRIRGLAGESGGDPYLEDLLGGSVAPRGPTVPAPTVAGYEDDMNGIPSALARAFDVPTTDSETDVGGIVSAALGILIGAVLGFGAGVVASQAKELHDHLLAAGFDVVEPCHQPKDGMTIVEPSAVAPVFRHVFGDDKGDKILAVAVERGWRYARKPPATPAVSGWESSLPDAVAAAFGVGDADPGVTFPVDTITASKPTDTVTPAAPSQPANAPSAAPSKYPLVRKSHRIKYPPGIEIVTEMTHVADHSKVAQTWKVGDDGVTLTATDPAVPMTPDLQKRIADDKAKGTPIPHDHAHAHDHAHGPDAPPPPMPSAPPGVAPPPPPPMGPPPSSPIAAMQAMSAPQQGPSGFQQAMSVATPIVNALPGLVSSLSSINFSGVPDAVAAAFDIGCGLPHTDVAGVPPALAAAFDVGAASGPKATGLLLPAVKAGRHVPPMWTDIPGPDGMTLTVAIDNLKASVDGGDPIRLPVSWPDTIAIARSQGWIAPSKRLADAIYAAAQVKTAFHSLVTASDSDSGGAKMHEMDFAKRYNADVDGQIAAAAAAPSALVAGHDKYWLLHPRLEGIVAATKRPAAINYGGWDKSGKPLQSPGGMHDIDYEGDYSQLLRPIKRYAKGADGSQVDLLDWIAKNEGVSSKYTELFKAGQVAA